MWMDWQQTTLVPDMTTVFWGLVRTPEAERDHAAIEAAAGRLGGLWRRLDEHLATRRFVAGDTLHDRRHPGRRRRAIATTSSRSSGPGLPRSRPGTGACRSARRSTSTSCCRSPERHSPPSRGQAIQGGTMRYRPFGRTGLQVSELVFGGGFVGGILIHARTTTPSSRRCERGLDGGMNWIDTAPSYGDGQSEEALGWLLEGGRRPSLICRPRSRLDLGRARRPPRPDRGEPRAEPEAAAARLGRSVPAAQPDRARRPPSARSACEQVLGADGVAETFERLRDQGLFKFFGITAFGDPRLAARGDRERPVRFRPGLLQPAQSERRPESAAGLGRAGLPRRARRLPRARRRGHEHPGARGRRDRDRPAPRPRDADRAGLRHRDRGGAGARGVAASSASATARAPRPRSASRWPIPTCPA